MKSYPHYGGIHPETALLKNILAYYDQKPLSEALLYGIGGGVGYGYFLFEMRGRIILVLGTSYMWQDSTVFLAKTAERIGLKTSLVQSGSQKTTSENLLKSLKAEQAVAVWVDQASLPYYALPDELKKYLLYFVGVTTYDGQNFWLDDRAGVPIKIAPDILATARAMQPYGKNKMMIFEPSERIISLEVAVADGIKLGCDYALNPPIKNFGLEALAKWANLLTHPKDKKSWLTVYAQPSQFYNALKDIFHAIETNGTGGGASRGMYADFLVEASAILGIDALKNLADGWREAASKWTTLANIVLPDDIEFLARTKVLIHQKWDLFEKQGDAATTQIQQIQQELDELSPEAESLDGQKIKELLTTMREQLNSIYSLEQRLMKELQAAI